MTEGDVCVRITGPRQDDGTYPAEVVAYVWDDGEVRWKAFGPTVALSANGHPAGVGKRLQKRC